MSPIRLGVIGAGLIWIRTQQPILELMADAFVPVAFCDVREERRVAIAQEFPDARVLSDYHSLLELPEVEAVLVLTPIALNAPVAHAALRAGKHVIMESRSLGRSWKVANSSLPLGNLADCCVLRNKWPIGAPTMCWPRSSLTARSANS